VAAATSASTGSAAETRRRLVEAATEAFAEQGAFTASLVDITRRAGQRNRGAVHYHFGSRDGLLVAVIDQHAGFLARREAELLERARSRPDDDIASVLEAVVRPTVELAETGPSGRRYLVIVGQLIEEFHRVRPDVATALARTGGYPVYELLEQRLPAYDDLLRTERLALVTSFILRSVARRARAQEPTDPGRPQLPTERFIANVVAMAVGMAVAPIPDAVDD
jgi:AcrR family transcriptional regulator